MNDDYTPRFEDYPTLDYPRSKPPTVAQISSLSEMGVALPPYPLTFDIADQLIRDNIDKWNNLPATPKQEAFLKRKCQWSYGEPIRRGKAAEMIAKWMQ